MQELRARMRVMEAKRGDDARHIRELETRLQEAESFVALRPKLQAKLTQLQTDLITTRRELADAQQLSQLAESRNFDNQEQLEMAMLDKEMAEERAEIAEADLEELKEKFAMVEVELEVLREGGGVYILLWFRGDLSFVLKSTWLLRRRRQWKRKRCQAIACLYSTGEAERAAQRSSHAVRAHKHNTTPEY